MNLRISMMLSLLLVLLSPSCAARDTTSSDETRPRASESGDAPLGDIPPVDWNNPIEGSEVASVAQATRHLDFPPYVPRGLGAPQKILINANPSVAFMYETSEYGLVVISEAKQQLSSAEFKEFMETVVRDVQLGTAEIVTVRGGIEALLIVPETQGQGASLRWQEHERDLDIRGPNLTREDVLQVAERI
jgi:hypothetical protein